MDTTVLIALIAGVFALLTLIVQTYGQLQIAKIKDVQAKQVEKVAEVHTLVNSGQTKLIERVEELSAEVGALKGVSAERDRTDAHAAGVIEGKEKKK